MPSTKGSIRFNLWIKNVLRYKFEVVAKAKGKTISDHTKWLMWQSVTNYEIQHGEIVLPEELRDETSKK